MSGHPHLTTLAAGAGPGLGRAIGLAVADVAHHVLDAGPRPQGPGAGGHEEETAFVLRGAGTVVVDGERLGLRAGDALHGHGERRPVIADVAEGGLELVVLGAGPGTGLRRRRPVGAGLVGGGVPDLDLPRMPALVRLADVRAERYDDPGSGGVERDLGDALGVQRAGLRHTTLDPGALSCPPHWHSAEEECFVVLEGAGRAWLGRDRLEIGPGSVLGRPPRSGVAHALEAGPDGLTYLAFGTRVDSDVAHYPRSQKVNIGGGVLFRVEPLDYWDGERP